jgi:hypothetical protein
MRHILTSLRLLILAAAICSAIPATAQPGVTSEGREFWLGFMPNYIIPAERIAVYVATSVPNKITVETYSEGGTIARSQSATLGADKTHRFEMSVAQSETRDREKPLYRAIKVTSTAPCVVIGYSDNSLSTDGYLGIPLPALGKEYYCASYYDNPTMSRLMMGRPSRLGQTPARHSRMMERQSDTTRALNGRST